MIKRASAHHFCSDAVYQMFGIVNVVLFAVTRPMLCSDAFHFEGWDISWPFGRPCAPQSQNSPNQAHHLATPPLSQESRDQRFQSVKPGPSWTQREIKPPPEIVVRDSIGSIYSIYNEYPQVRFKPTPLSRWSPETPPKSGRR